MSASTDTSSGGAGGSGCARAACCGAGCGAGWAPSNTAKKTATIKAQPGTTAAPEGNHFVLTLSLFTFTDLSARV